jgi:hypothetical protein
VIFSPQAVLDAIDALNEVGAPYLLTGSLARNVYIVPRSTNDGDFVVEMNADQLESLFLRLTERFLQEPQMAFETVTGKLQHRFLHRQSKFLIEVFQADFNDPHERSRFERRLPVDVDGRKSFVPTPEDIVIQKLRWYHRLHRDKDRNDLRELVDCLKSTLDWPYIRRWADIHSTGKSLAEFTSAADGT